MLLVFGKVSEFYISRQIQNGRSSFRTLQACNAYVFTDLAEQIVFIAVTCCYLPTEQKASDDISETNSSENIMQVISLQHKNNQFYTTSENTHTHLGLDNIQVTGMGFFITNNPPSKLIG